MIVAIIWAKLWESQPMSVPASEPFPPPAHKVPYFQGAFFWYVAWRIALTVAFMMGTFVYFFVAGMLFPEQVDALLEQTGSWEKAANIIMIVLSLLLCILVAGRYELGFGKGFLLFFAGNFVSNIICAPLYGVALMGDDNAGMGWVAGYLLLILIYAGGCAFFMWRKRKELVEAKAQTVAISTFD
jgi:hypothetical protein